MKINHVNYTSPLKNINNKNTELKNISQRTTPSFGANPFAGMAVGLASFIENNGFMGEFLTIDTTGMGLPRATQGYLRNREELGHLNYRAGHEEVIRELLSGPAFFFVPLLTTLALGAVAGKSARVPRKTLTTFHNLMKNTEVNLKNTVETKKNFIKTVVNEAFSDFHNDRNLVDDLSNIMERYATEKIPFKNRFSNLFRKEPQKLETQARLQEKAEEILTKLNKSNEKNLDNTDILKLGSVTNPETQKTEAVYGNVKVFMDDMKNYLDDFTSKAAVTNKDKDAFVESFHKNAKTLRATAEVGAITALCTFLMEIPKIYQIDKLFPGTDGLKGAANDAALKAKAKEVA